MDTASEAPFMDVPVTQTGIVLVLNTRCFEHAFYYCSINKIYSVQLDVDILSYLRDTKGSHILTK